MSPESNQGFRLKEACLLTGASWAAFICHEMDAWRVEKTFQLPRSRRALLMRFLQGNKFSAWLGDLPSKKRPKALLLDDSAELDCQRLYAFPVTSMTLMLVGVSGILDSKNQRIWKLAANIDVAAFSVPADDEVDLLQNAVLELQLTQQELQARINAQREAEARLIQAAKLAAVGELAAGVAHELNNPLTSVVGFTELALDELPPDASARKDLELVLQEARRARSVVRSLLDFARQTETMRVKADINEIVDDVLMLTRHLMQSSNVQLAAHFGENLKWVMVDRNQIKQVVINLITNALYAMPEGGRIVVETAELPRYGRQWLTLSIRDNGIGIPQENLERIFEPFFTTRADRGGTGLGLSVTYGIVTDHGGMIEVESQLQVGSTFVVWLPLDQTI
jgi:signal transduction histidine kinase